MALKTFIYTNLIAGCINVFAQTGFNSKKHTTDSSKIINQNIIKKDFKIGNNQNNSAKTSQSKIKKISNLSYDFQNKKPFKELKITSLGNSLHLTTKPNVNNFRTGKNLQKSDALNNYLTLLKSTSKIPTLKSATFQTKSTKSEFNGNFHIKSQQTHNGIKIWGKEIITHYDAQNNGIGLNGNLLEIKSDISAINISELQAIEIVKNDLKSKTKFQKIPKELVETLELDTLHSETIYVANSINSLLLCYHIEIHPNIKEHWNYFISTESGEIVNYFKSSCHIDGPKTTTALDLNNVLRPVNSFLNGSNYVLTDASKPMYNTSTKNGIIQTLDAKNSYGSNFKTSSISNTNNIWNNPTAVSAHYNASVAYDYYLNNHGRNSIDDKNGNIYSIINVVDDDGTAMDNAYWNGKAMFYGNGSVAFKPLAGGLDVGGHEMTHGVVQNSANLIYQGESGAINESMADIFGVMMDSTDWNVGEDVVKSNYFPSGALRSLSDPHNGGTSLNDNSFQPKHMNEKYNGAQDNGGVHINSGIPNYAFYLLATSINSRQKAAKIFYRALTVYLTQNSNFFDLRVAAIQSATDLFGANSNFVTQTANAFDAVGITSDGQSTSTRATSTFTENPGSEYILFNSTISGDPYGLYITNLTDEKGVTTPIVKNKPSITDNGQTAVFVGTNSKIYTVNVDPSTNNINTLKIFDNRNIWGNASISKDGKRIAAVTSGEDTSIYVFDISTNRVAKFRIYNPTFSENVKSGGPLYADGLEWDYTGENIVYDAFNSVNSTDGTNLEYWDINIINVWNNTTNNYSDGQVFKLISDLAPGESIGNPSFSKNSPHIIAFDYENSVENIYYEVGLNLETNDINIIAENNSLGWPSYNKSDEFLVFSAYNSTFTDYEVDYVAVNADKISSDFVPNKLIDKAVWGMFYTVGDRSTTVGIFDQSYESNTISIFPNPAKNQINITSKFTINNIQIFDLRGNLVQELNNLNSLETSLNIDQLNTELYTIKIQTPNHNYFSKLAKFE